MPDETDPIRKTWARDLALATLKEARLFRNTSWRLLRDFVDAAGTATFVDPSVRARDVQLLAVAGSRVRVMPEGALVPKEFDPGVHFTEHDGFQGEVRIESASPRPAAVFWVEPDHWAVIGDSPALAHSLSTGSLPAHIAGSLDELALGARREFVWVGCSQRLDPLKTLLVQLVAAGLSRMSPHPVFTVALGNDGSHRVADWRDPRSPAVAFVSDEVLERLLREGGAAEAAHVLFHWSQRPLDVPELGPFASAMQVFHRILLFHEGAAPAIPSALYRLLRAGLIRGPGNPTPAGGGRFSSIVSATICPPRRPAPRDGGAQELLGGGTPGGELRATVGGLYERVVRLLARRRHFETAPVVDETGGYIERNDFRVELDLGDLDRGWRRWQQRLPAGEEPNEAKFVADLIANDGYRRGAERLARGASNRQVGIAVSGGGASAFRVAPLLELLETGDKAVPIDYFAGVSGGALVGAYYCALGVPGLKRLVAQAGRMGRMLPLLSVTSWPLEAWIDVDLQGLRIEDLDTPTFLPVATELAGEAAPRPVVVVAGTLGEAVRASGALPLIFAPTEKNGRRYGDGAAAALIPVQMLDRADVILACNVVPGPKHSNPWYDVEPVVLAHRYTPVGRAIDLWTWAALLLQNATASAGKGANAFLWFEPQRYPSREAVEWGRAGAIVAEGRDDRKVEGAARKLYEAWRAVGT